MHWNHQTIAWDNLQAARHWLATISGTNQWVTAWIDAFYDQQGSIESSFQIFFFLLLVEITAYTCKCLGCWVQRRSFPSYDMETHHIHSTEGFLVSPQLLFHQVHAVLLLLLCAEARWYRSNTRWYRLLSNCVWITWLNTFLWECHRIAYDNWRYTYISRLLHVFRGISQVVKCQGTYVLHRYDTCDHSIILILVLLCAFK